MKHLFSVLALASVFYACTNHSAGGDTPGADTAASAATTAPADSTGAADSSDHVFFPVADFIGGQIKMVDSLKPPLTKSVTIGGKTTPMTLGDAEFGALASAFRRPDINDPALKKLYKETNYADQSIPSVVFTYTSTDPSTEIRKIDVIIQPDPVRNDKVRSIYIEKEKTSGDTALHQKLYWRADHNFMIVTEKQVGKTLLPAEQVKVIWNP